MSAPTDTDSDRIPSPLRVRVDEVCDRFEAACLGAAAGGRRVEDYLPDAPDPVRPALLRELVALDVYYRRRRGEDPRPEDYRERFKDLDPAWLVEATAPAPAADGLAPASPPPARCPHCHHPVRPDAALCPGCGGPVPGRDRRPPALAEPTQLGKFRLLRQVGLGAFGEVWQAQDTELDRPVALKFPHPSLLSSPAYLERFYREARAAAQLRHPGIVTVHEVTTLQGRPVIVSDFVDGVTLRDLLRDRRLTFREAAALVADVADALDYAHAMGMVHRDIKPANVMVESADGRAPGKPRVVDFGLARREEAEVTMTLDGQVIGTPAYMSPEQAAGQGRKVDRRSDVYSLGVLLYELLCGELPFRGSKQMMLHQVLQKDPRPPRRVNDQVPRDLETVCLKAMAKEPARRYGSARDLADDLRRFLAGEPVRARPVGAWERAVRWARRRPQVAALLAAVVLVTVLGLVGVTWQWQRAAGARRQLEQTDYYQRVALGLKAWEVNNFAEADRLLEDCPVEKRGWEWHYVKGLRRHGRPVFSKHRGGVLAVSFNRDGSRIATTGADGVVRIWDANTGQDLFPPLGGSGNPYFGCVAFSPDDRYLAAGFGPIGERVKVWEVATGKEVYTFTGHQAAVHSLAFSPDGSWVASAGADRSVRVWDPATGQEAFAIPAHTGPVHRVAFHPDGTLLAAPGSDRTVNLWDARTGRHVYAFVGHTVEPMCVAFSRDGKFLASSGGTQFRGADGEVKVWNLETRRVVRDLRGHNGVVENLSFHPDGTRLASAGFDLSVKLWDLTTELEAMTLTGHTDRIWCLAFSPDGRRLVSGGDDGTVRVWDATPLEEPAPEGGHRDRVTSLAFSRRGPGIPNGGFLVSSSVDKTVKVWDPGTRREIRPPLEGYESGINKVAVSENGRLVAAGGAGGTIWVWDVATGQRVHVYKGHLDPTNPAEKYYPLGKPIAVRTLAFLPGTEHVASAGWDGLIRVWNARDGTPVRELPGHTSGVTELAFTRDGKRLASSSWDWTVRVWDLETGRRFEIPFPGRVFSVAFSPDGERLAAATTDGVIRFCDARTGAEVKDIPVRTGWIWCVAYSPDGTLLASAGNDATIRIWDASSYREVATLRGHERWVESLAFSPDGTQLASAGWDGKVKFWAVPAAGRGPPQGQ